MTKLNDIRNDLVLARKAGDDKEKVALLSTLIGEATAIGKNNGNRETTDAETISHIRKMIKTDEENLTLYENQGRDTGHIHREIAILADYLPEEVPEADVEATVREILSQNAGGNPKAMLGVIIKGLNAAYGVKFNGNVMVPIAKRILEA